MTHLLRALGRVLLGTLVAAAGVLHLVRPEVFGAQVPSWFPLDERVTVIGSGVVEVVLGVAFVVLPRRRRLLGWALAAFFVAVFPGNLAQYVEGVDAFGLDTDRARLVRLFFQPLLVLWALWAGGIVPRERATVRADADRSSPP